MPFAPMGLPGVVKGTSAAFFGYFGYDEVYTAAVDMCVRYFCEIYLRLGRYFYSTSSYVGPLERTLG